MDTSSFTYDPYINTNNPNFRDTEETIEDLEKVIHSLQGDILELKEYCSALDQRTKILIREYNLKMALEERDFE
jgi:predicted RNase H-like nuclease (RuvC/YqgF family)